MTTFPKGVKICGLRRPADVAAAVAAGAAYAGFVFYPPSPRNLAPDEAAALAAAVPPELRRVGLIVDADDAAIDALLARVSLDMLQLHGRETPERTRAIRARTGLPVIKALGIGRRADLAAPPDYADAADMMLYDARPPRGSDRPGGHGQAFDWGLLGEIDHRLPWMLAGGLTPSNVAEAMRRTGAIRVDVSSGVETAPGVKDPACIAAFLQAARAVSMVPR